MAQWSGLCGVRLRPLADALRDFILGHGVVHADETPVKRNSPTTPVLARRSAAGQHLS